MTILEELYNGNICPGEKFAKAGGEYARMSGELSKKIDRFIPMLNEAEIKLWEDIMETKNTMEVISDRQNFIDGFCMGARIMLEILDRDLTDRTIL
ncbi:MAG: hypothetical protein IJ386_04035 [Clostridia bacterium]|nr:hypothetical protein [Clostridia bacterium]